MSSLLLCSTRMCQGHDLLYASVFSSGAGSADLTAVAPPSCETPVSPSAMPVLNSSTTSLRPDADLPAQEMDCEESEQREKGDQ